MIQSPTPGYISRQTIIPKDTCIPMFTAALFTIAKTQKQPKYPLIDEWMKGMRYISVYTHRHTHNQILLLLLLLLSHFSRIQLCATPWTAAHQAPPSLGFSRQEHWSGLPFPSPMHESEKGKWSRSVVSDSLRRRGPQPTRLLCPWDFPGKSTGVGCHWLLCNEILLSHKK